MRVITGQARGLRLLSPEGREIRPTSDRTKEAMFSILQNDVGGAAALDLFAGTGQLGIEALSRGARLCVFVDASRAAVQLVRENLRRAGFDSPSARVVQSDAAAFARAARERFDIALLDPPYRSGMLEELLPQVAGLMNDGGVIVCETDLRVDPPLEAGKFRAVRGYRYGKTKLTLYRAADGEGEALCP